MNIFVDESGTFVSTDKPSSWNAVAAIAAAEPARRVLSESLAKLRSAAGARPNEEVKLHQVDEETLVKFLRSIDHPNILVFAVATDASLNTLSRIREHQALHVADTRANIPRMHFEGGKAALALLAQQVEGLSPQLYVQLICQVDLFEDIITRAVNYFVQRKPQTLRDFRWRIDQKNSAKPTFEETFLKVAPPLLQTRSIREPMIMIRQFDYSEMNAYEFDDGKAPDYLQRDYGLPAMEGYDLQKILRKNIDFVDSKMSEGVQAADLVAGCLRRLLRGNFSDCDRVAEALGALMLENRKGKHPILLTGFTGTDVPVGASVASAMRVFERKCRRLLLPRRGDFSQVAPSK